MATGTGLAVLLAGCAEVEAGSPIAAPQDSPSPSSSSPAFPPSTTSEDKESPLDSIDPCALLTEDEVAQLGDFKEPESRELAGDPTCKWLPVRGPTDASLLPTIGFVLWDDLSIDEIRDRGFGVEHGQMDSGREFTRSAEDDACTVALAVGEQARVDALVPRHETFTTVLAGPRRRSAALSSIVIAGAMPPSSALQLISPGAGDNHTNVA